MRKTWPVFEATRFETGLHSECGTLKDQAKGRDEKAILETCEGTTFSSLSTLHITEIFPHLHQGECIHFTVLKK